MSLLDFFGKKNRSLGGFSDNRNKIQQAIVAEEDFIQACLRRDLGALVEDILQPYIFNEKDRMDNVYGYDLRAVRQKSSNIRDVLLAAMLGEDVIVSKVHLFNSLAQKDYLFIGDPNEQRKLLSEIYGENLEIIKTIVVEHIFSAYDVQLLLLCYSALAHAYNRQNKINKLDSKMIFKMKGFHAIFTQPKNDEEEGVAIENRKRLIANFEEILNGTGGVIDAEDSIGLVSGSAQNAEQSLLSSIQIIYQEIARILRIPLTRLLGRAPQGMNATGESDALNYDMTLDIYRSLWLEPALKLLGIEYKKVDKIDIAYLRSVIDMHLLTETPISDVLRAKIAALGEEL